MVLYPFWSICPTSDFSDFPMITVMACVQPGDNKLSNGGVLFMDWVLQGASWDDVLLGLSGSSRIEDMGGVDMALD